VNGDTIIFVYIVLVLMLLIGIVVLTLTHQQDSRTPGFTTTDLEKIKQSMRIIEKDGKCYSIIEMRTYFGYTVISHTWVPCEKRAE
jgi:hypothetical protein